MTKPRVLIAGLGDTGLLTAIHLSKHADVVGVSTKPGLVSGQELGLRLTRPAEWVRDYWISFDRYRQLDRVRILHGTLVGLDVNAKRVTVQHPDGGQTVEPYDALKIPEAVCGSPAKSVFAVSGEITIDGNGTVVVCVENFATTVEPRSMMRWRLRCQFAKY